MRLVEGVLKRGIASDLLPAGNIRLLVEMFLGMLRVIVLYRSSRDTPEALAHLVVSLFLDGLRGRTGHSVNHGTRAASGGKNRERAAAHL